MRSFRQVDVFTSKGTLGNALAVVHEADGLPDQAMAAFARWTNLSETTFLLAPTSPDADYRVRIFTTGGELPFAGHPTLGSAHAWLAAGGRPHRDRVIVQECGVGLVTIKREADRLAFAAPALLRSREVAATELAVLLGGLGLRDQQVLAASWIDNGPGWVGLELASAADVLGIVPDPVALAGRKVGVLGRHDAADAARLGVDVEVRAFYADDRDFAEDPVTGSLNAGMAQWLIGAGRLPTAYVAGQGRVLGRDGRVHVSADADGVWIGGDVVTVIEGSVAL